MEDDDEDNEYNEYKKFLVVFERGKIYNLAENNTQSVRCDRCWEMNLDTHCEYFELNLCVDCLQDINDSELGIASSDVNNFLLKLDEDMKNREGNDIMVSLMESGMYRKNKCCIIF
jgi:hypothetical protein